MFPLLLFSVMSLPTNLTSGKARITKRIMRDSKVMDYITEVITKTRNDYFKGNCKWRDGTRSDIVLDLEPKSFSLKLLPIILEI